MNDRDVARVIDAYDTSVRATSTTTPHDAMKAVVEDTDGEVGWEVVQTATQMGYALDETDVDTLLAAADAYRTRLATEAATKP